MKGRMRHWGWAALSVALGACGSGPVRTTGQVHLSACAAGGDLTLTRVWSVDNGHGEALGLARSPSDTVAVSSADGSVKTWDLRLGARVWSTPSAAVGIYGGEIESAAVTRALAFSPDGAAMVTGTEQGEVLLRAAGDGRILGQLHLGEAPIATVASHGARIAAADTTFAGNVTLSDGVSEERVRLAATQLWNVRALTFFAGGRELLVAGDWYGVPWVEVWDPATPEGPRATWSSFPLSQAQGAGGPAQVTAVAGTADGGRIVAGGTGFVVVLSREGLDSEAAYPQAIVPGHQVRTVSVSPDGSVFATAGEDGTVRLWRTADATALGSLSLPGVVDATLSADGFSLITVERSGALAVWGCGG